MSFEFIDDDDLDEIEALYGSEWFFLTDDTDGATTIVSVSQLVQQARKALQWYGIVMNADTHARPEK